MKNEFIAGLKDGAIDLADKAKGAAIKAMDKNEDGIIDKDDAKVVVEELKNGAKEVAETLKRVADEKSLEFEDWMYSPIFVHNLTDSDFCLSKIVRLCDVDKKRMNKRACKDSIGYYSDVKGTRVVNMYPEMVPLVNITLFPDEGYEFYYVDPTDRNRYIALDEYFNQLKVERVSELQKIAHDLGATHFKVTYKEEKTYFSKKKKNANVLSPVSGEFERETEVTGFGAIQIAAEMDCEGHDPKEPELRFFKNDRSIKQLIEMRLDESAALKHQKFVIKLSNTSGIKENDAIVVDAYLKKLKCSGNATMSSEVKNESRRYLEYEIDF
ncbi:hypothetical protein SAMN02910358_01095 [Lachnospiraceae bacterium XBB1006]|nr:hypothetical protein SAMN02910358_01095 [Lachnospiraceae bacterium XBB1006]